MVSCSALSACGKSTVPGIDQGIRSAQPARDYKIMQQSSQSPVSRRQLLQSAGLATVGAVMAGTSSATIAAEANPEPVSAKNLRGLMSALQANVGRRDFREVPMILTDPSDWDDKALKLLFAYAGQPKEIFDNTDLFGPWLNLMRNTMNAMVYAWKQPDFLATSATHGPAAMALYDQHVWDKYNLPGFIARKLDKKIDRNTFIEEKSVAKASADDVQNETGPFSAVGNNIPALQRRGVVFLACHNAIWELSEALMKSGHNPDKLSHGQLAADLTNHLVEGAVLTPGILATVAVMQRNGFHYVI